MEKNETQNVEPLDLAIEVLEERIAPSNRLATKASLAGRAMAVAMLAAVAVGTLDMKGSLAVRATAKFVVSVN